MASSGPIIMSRIPETSATLATNAGCKGGLGGILPEVLDEEELDVCLMKEIHRVVQEHGSVDFMGQTYRGECLKDRKFLSQTITLRIDYDHALRLRAYTDEDETYSRTGQFLGFVDALNLNYQDLSLEDVKEVAVDTRNKKAPWSLG
ncbi:Mu transposase C-terminal domain-containing protein [Microcoleus sp. FACHB-1515]|uniref:Mu transposase C-terminal domain-containing protein n=1 Tax=Cyanophyceae TaxID=3028117 RepID=UPI00168863DC|nr:Mu transposase C-terminal domain-containing protein [Microcoleus sp. FACHB-1515]MBD2091399.1 Mu transposase C-terminal domain-containing protein [Microcoleus sp. FACHB-1515]